MSTTSTLRFRVNSRLCREWARKVHRIPLKKTGPVPESIAYMYVCEIAEKSGQIKCGCGWVWFPTNHKGCWTDYSIFSRPGHGAKAFDKHLCLAGNK